MHRALALLLPLLTFVDAPAQTTLYDLTGTTRLDHSGTAVATFGDLNGDGVDEFAVGSPGDATHGIDAGRVDLYDGRTGVVRFTWLGDGPDFLFGTTVIRVHDLDRDGMADVLIGAPGSRGVGYVRAFSTRDGSLLRTYANEIGFPGRALASLGDLDGDGVGEIAVGVPFAPLSPGVLRGKVSVYSGNFGHLLWETRGRDGLDQFGSTLTTISDLNGDGAPELVVGAPATSSQGYVQVHASRDGLLLYRVEGALRSAFGEAVAGVGDVNGDGTNDLAIGARFDEVGVIGSGSIHLHSGADGTFLAKIEGRESLEFLGQRLASCGDVDGDGIDDLLAGSPEWQLRTGRAMVYAMGRLGTIAFEVAGTSQGTRFGDGLACGDVNGDGVLDLLVGAPLANAEAGVTIVRTPLDLELHAIDPPHASFRGGELLTIRGRAFSGQSTIRVDGELAHVNPIDGATLAVTLPRLARAGVAVDVTLEQNGVLRTLQGNLRVTPFHSLHERPSPGLTIELGVQARAGDLVFVFGGAPPTNARTIPGFGGTLAIDPFVPLGLAFLQGTDEVRFPFILPNDPSHIGTALVTQALVGPGFAVDDTAFTNVVAWSIVP